MSCNTEIYREIKSELAEDPQLLESKNSVAVVEAIFGSRRKILFVEGADHSLDLTLYSIIYNDLTIRAVGSCRDVISMTRCIKESSDLHEIEAYGIVDHDQMNAEKISELRSQNIYALRVHSVESLYYHPKVINLIAEYLKDSGFDIPHDFSARVDALILQSFQRIKNICLGDTKSRFASEFIDRERPTTKDFRVPKKWSIDSEDPILVDILNRAENHFDELIANSDIEGLVIRYNIKKSDIPNKIAVELLGLKNREKYENLVRSFAGKQDELKKFLRTLIPLDL